MYHAEMTFVDVAVVGAGPAGAWTACTLARGGARVALVDGSHPREKPCGGGVTGRALDLVAGALGTAELDAVVVRSARLLRSDGVTAAVVPLEARGVSPASALVVVGRARFDAALLDAAARAGAALVTSRVAQIARDGARWRLTCADGRRIDATMLVGADGANSFVRRQVAAPFRRDQLSIATGFFARGTTSDEIVIDFVTDPPGYIWSFPRADHLAIGICAQADAGATAADLRARAARWIRDTRIADGAALEPYSWPIPSLDAAAFERLTPAGPGWLLVGDAAGLVDPITREGIFFALQAAGWAADSILAAPEGAERVYAARVRKRIGADLARAARYKAGFFQPRFAALLVEALAQCPKVAAVMADLVAGRQPYAGLKRRLLGTLELGLAWKALTARRSRRAPAPATRDA